MSWLAFLFASRGNNSAGNIDQSQMLGAYIERSGELKRGLENEEAARRRDADSHRRKVKELNETITRQGWEIDEYKELLAKPMHEIAQQNEDFKKTYELQQKVLADFIFSYSAMRELASQYAIDSGISEEKWLQDERGAYQRVFEMSTRYANKETIKYAYSLGEPALEAREIIKNNKNM